MKVMLSRLKVAPVNSPRTVAEASARGLYVFAAGGAVCSVDGSITCSSTDQVMDALITSSDPISGDPHVVVTVSVVVSVLVYLRIWAAFAPVLSATERYWYDFDVDLLNPALEP